MPHTFNGENVTFFPDAAWNTAICCAAPENKWGRLVVI